MTEQNGYHPTSNGVCKDDDDQLFDVNLFQSIFKEYSLKDPKLEGDIYDKKYRLRSLAISDYHHGYVDLLRQLTECGTITAAGFEERFKEMKQCPNTYHILVLQDIQTDHQIVGAATLVCEKKFIRQLATRGRIEDVIVHDRCRGQQLGKLLIALLTQLAREKCDCYKISLECKDQLVSFYEQFGYHHEEKQNYLCQRFKNVPTNLQETANQ